MAILLVMASAAISAAHGHPALYAGAYAATRIVLFVLRLAMRGRGPTGSSNWPPLISRVLWGGSALLQPPLPYLLRAHPEGARRGRGVGLPDSPGIPAVNGEGDVDDDLLLDDALRHDRDRRRTG